MKVARREERKSFSLSITYARVARTVRSARLTRDRFSKAAVIIWDNCFPGRANFVLFSVGCWVGRNLRNG